MRQQSTGPASYADIQAAKADRREHNSPTLGKFPTLAQAFGTCRWHVQRARDLVKRVDESRRRTRRFDA